MKKFMMIVAVACSGFVCACDSKVEEEQKTGSVTNECPAATTTTTTGSGGASTTEPAPGACVVSEDCAVPANCVLCPGDDVCKPVTATCVEGTCQLNQPDCPVSSGGAGQGGAASGGASAGGAASGGASTGGAAQGGAPGTGGAGGKQP